MAPMFTVESLSHPYKQNMNKYDMVSELNWKKQWVKSSVLQCSLVRYKWRTKVRDAGI